MPLADTTAMSRSDFPGNWYVKAIFVPSGDQSSGPGGPRNGDGGNGRSRSSWPFWSTESIPSLLTNAIREPSGDQVGYVPFTPRSRTFEPSAFIVSMRPAWPNCTNATVDPSGETAGMYGLFGTATAGVRCVRPVPSGSTESIPKLLTPVLVTK